MARSETFQAFLRIADLANRGRYEEAAGALAELGDAVEGDAPLLALRARVAIGRSDFPRATADLRRLLETTGERLGLDALLSALPEEGRDSLLPSVAGWAGRIPPGPLSDEVARLVRVFREEKRPREADGHLARMAGEGDRRRAEVLWKQAIHPLYAAAVEAAPEGDRPPLPWHLGGGRPALTARDVVLVGLFCAERVAPRLAGADHDDGDRAQFDRALRLVRAHLADPASVTDLDLRTVSQTSRRTAAMVVGCLAAHMAWVSRRQPGAIWVSAEKGLSRAVGAIARKAPRSKGPAESTADFLKALDDEIVRVDALAALRDHAPPEVELARVLWRGVPGPETRRWLVKLKNGRYGMLVRPPVRWSWAEGTRDDMLATVPDESFAEAVATATARDR